MGGGRVPPGDQSGAAVPEPGRARGKPAPPFEGIFGTAFSGYLVKPDSVDESDQLMLFYTADYRSELLGVFDAVETLQVLTAHYDRRRSQCLLC